MLELSALVQAVPQPYYYFELWLSALLAWALPLAPAVSLFVLAYTVLLIVLYIGYCALFNHFGQPCCWGPPACLSRVFSAGVQS